ncbi:hypothetical protein [Alkalilimnicola ehrlichii]|uniref:hypothetical protein n=1 Tax=Alkalilimnicola ehrlichii TaxID=351052 RepID=UPI002162003F|nr:hypothetical protein [Alkalilimnicola ehrlichii]
MDIKDRIVVVTGAAGGIGRALALRFAKPAPNVSSVPTSTRPVRRRRRNKSEASPGG